ncbi:MAG TPA: fatty acid desaturase, partial [Ferruginibacter sp.]|nr:fatty acid desaturase [Ferruginibacter sp.]
MRIRAFKYLSPITIYFLAILSFTIHGWAIWLPLMYAWLLLPVAELFIKPDEHNLDAAEEEMVRQDRFYDYLLYLIVPMQYGALCYFLVSMQHDKLEWWEIAGRIWTMGLLCGSLGINVAHELGHRINKFEQFLAKSLLLTSLYMHFFIEHNKGHHKNVATPEDPSSARYNEPVYTFYFRTVIFSYLSAWKIAGNDVQKQGYSIFSWRNEMLQAHVIQILFVGLIFYFFGWLITIYFLLA